MSTIYTNVPEPWPPSDTLYLANFGDLLIYAVIGATITISLLGGSALAIFRLHVMVQRDRNPKDIWIYAKYAKHNLNNPTSAQLKMLCDYDRRRLINDVDGNFHPVIHYLILTLLTGLIVASTYPLARWIEPYQYDLSRAPEIAKVLVRVLTLMETLGISWLLVLALTRALRRVTRLLSDRREVARTAVDLMKTLRMGESKSSLRERAVAVGAASFIHAAKRYGVPNSDSRMQAITLETADGSRTNLHAGALIVAVQGITIDVYRGRYEAGRLSRSRKLKWLQDDAVVKLVLQILAIFGAVITVTGIIMKTIFSAS